MKVLVTGSSGKVGSVVAGDLQKRGHEVVEFDRSEGRDIEDLPAVTTASVGCDGVIHAAALLGLPNETPEEIMRVNVQGTWNVLSAAKTAGVARVVSLSSVDALGLFKGERTPDYLPLDDEHPCYPATPYAISKRLGEEMCRFFSASSGTEVICLRPPGVWEADTYEAILAARAERASFEWDPFWEYGAFLDVGDLSDVCIRALTCVFEGFACLLVSASDITTSGRTSRELVEFVHPDVEWRGGESYRDDPFRSLMVCDNARRILGWAPRHTWRSFVAGYDSGTPPD